MLFVVMFFGLGIDFSLHILRAMAEGSVGEQGLKSTFKDTAPALDHVRSHQPSLFSRLFLPIIWGRGTWFDFSGRDAHRSIPDAIVRAGCLSQMVCTFCNHTQKLLSDAQSAIAPRGGRLLGYLFQVGSPFALAIALDTQFNYNVLSMRDPTPACEHWLIFKNLDTRPTTASTHCL